MTRYRIIALSILVLCGSALIFLMYVNKSRTQLDSTLAPFFQLLGKGTKSFNRTLSRVIPVGDIEEREFGEAIADRYGDYTDKSCKEYKYLNDLMVHIAKFRKKPFDYRVFFIDEPTPNAFATPGGVIFVTSALLYTLKNEAELCAVLAHEMGHIELAHCFEAVRFQLLAKKIGSAALGELADMAVNLLMRHSFSKTQEDEADVYSWELILNTRYNPAAVGGAFASLLGYCGPGHRKDKRADIIRDYFMSHPPLELRSEKFLEKARIWRLKHPLEPRYDGRENLRKRTSFYAKSDFKGEWETGKGARKR